MIDRVTGEVIEARIGEMRGEALAVYQHLVAEIRNAMRQGFLTSGRHLKALRDSKAWASAGHKTFGACCSAEFDMDESTATRWIVAAEVCDRDLLPNLTIGNNLLTNGNREESLPTRETHVRELLPLKTSEQRAAVWSRVLEHPGITAQVVAAERERYLAELARDWITLEEWGEMSEDDRARACARRDSSKTFNETNDNIEWASWSWNPVTGCLHNCDYCYARDIANRFFPQRFAPSFLPSRLSMPANTTPGEDQAGRSVFVCSMADLFGKWVPREWIEAVLDAVRENPQWTYLFLTKFPQRMAEFTYPKNAWLGTTVDRQWAVQRAESAFDTLRTNGYDGVAWLSCEPMMERLTFSRLDLFDWVVMGGATKSTQTPVYHVPEEDRDHLLAQARAAGCMFYAKTNWWGEESRVREYPAADG